MNRFERCAEREFGVLPRIVSTLLSGILFVFLIPYALILLGPKADKILAIPAFSLSIPCLIAVTLIMLLGLGFALWSILSQLLRAQGTPLPMMPTKKLLVSGPFRYTRNPMSLGTILLYLGLAVLVGSWSSVGLVLVLSSLLIVYLKTIEENELEARFGEEYVEYKRAVPFLIPRFW